MCTLHTYHVRTIYLIRNLWWYLPPFAFITHPFYWAESLISRTKCYIAVSTAPRTNHRYTKTIPKFSVHHYITIALYKIFGNACLKHCALVLNTCFRSSSVLNIITMVNRTSTNYPVGIYYVFFFMYVCVYVWVYVHVYVCVLYKVNAEL